MGITTCKLHFQRSFDYTLEWGGIEMYSLCPCFLHRDLHWVPCLFRVQSPVFAGWARTSCFDLTLKHDIIPPITLVIVTRL